MEMCWFHAVGSIRTKRASTGCAKTLSSMWSVESYRFPSKTVPLLTYVHGPVGESAVETKNLVTRCALPRRDCVATPVMVLVSPTSMTYHC